jgi:hypothetical protein
MFWDDWGILAGVGGPVAVWIYDLASMIYGSFCPAEMTGGKRDG